MEDEPRGLNKDITIVEGPSKSFMAQIKSALEMDDRIVKIIKEINNRMTGPHLLDWVIEKG